MSAGVNGPVLRILRMPTRGKKDTCFIFGVGSDCESGGCVGLHSLGWTLVVESVWREFDGGESQSHFLFAIVDRGSSLLPFCHE